MNRNGWGAHHFPKKSKSDYLRALLAKLKAAAALQQISLGDYIKDMSEAHVQELEKKGLLLEA